jgi:hypothetical protein
MSTSLVLLRSATSPLGEQLLLKLALAGFEVTAQVPAAPWRGRTDEYAAQVRAEPLPEMVAAEPGQALIVVAAAPPPLAEVEATLAFAGQIEHWLQCAEDDESAASITTLVSAAGVPVTTVLHPRPLGSAVAEARRLLEARTPVAAWRTMLRPTEAVADESQIATEAIAAMSRGRSEARVDAVDVSMPGLLHAIARHDARRPWWLSLVPGAGSAPDTLRLRSSLSSHSHS